MGQQQLLLLVLGIVIVGIAVVAGITAFSEGKQKADRDAASADAMRIVSDIQAWKLKPTAFGGGANGDDTDFADASFKAIGITPTSGSGATAKYATTSGCYMITGSAGNAVVTVYQTDCTTQISTVTIEGTSPSDLEWAYSGS